jgi:hypothetical protein
MPNVSDGFKSQSIEACVGSISNFLKKLINSPFSRS